MGMCVSQSGADKQAWAAEGKMEAGRAGEQGHGLPLPAEVTCVPAGNWSDIQSRYSQMDSLLSWYQSGSMLNSRMAGGPLWTEIHGVLMPPLTWHTAHV